MGRGVRWCGTEIERESDRRWDFEEPVPFPLFRGRRWPTEGRVAFRLPAMRVDLAFGNRFDVEGRLRVALRNRRQER